MKLNDIFNIVKKENYCFSALIFSFLGLVSGYYFNIELLAFYSSVLLFATFDALSFHFCLKQNTEPDVIVPYRLIESTFQYLIGFILLIFNIKICILYFVAWWMGICDVLYYVVLQENFLAYDDMKWLEWSGYGLVCTLFNKPIKGKNVLIVTILTILFITAFIILGY